MRTHQVEYRTSTTRPLDIVDVTEHVRSALAGSSIADGRITVFAPDPGCSLIVNERESGLLADIRKAIDRFPRTAPAAGAASVVVPAVAGELRLGTWQRIMLVDATGQGERSLVVQVVGE